MTMTSQSHDGGSQRRTRPAGDNSLSRKLRGLGSFFEALFVLSLTFIAFGFYVMSRYDAFQVVWLLCVACLALLVALTVVSYRRAVKFNLKSRQADSLAERLSSYEVTDQRIKTLEVISVPADVLDCLRGMLGNGNNGNGSSGRVFNGEGDFVVELEEKLGPERTREFEEVILKYTRARDAGHYAP
jgi:hypothetical protein